MTTQIKLDEKDLEDIIRYYFRGLKEATVHFEVHEDVAFCGDHSYKITATVNTKENIIMY